MNRVRSVCVFLVFHVIGSVLAFVLFVSHRNIALAFLPLILSCVVGCIACRIRDLKQITKVLALVVVGWMIGCAGRSVVGMAHSDRMKLYAQNPYAETDGIIKGASAALALGIVGILFLPTNSVSESTDDGD
ncbi:hypothetical protein K239x_24630 [Planctomycetes bacterium K23_9]|uniref:Transmembrane protein n=1 Tax=Stieleria marina TaxID=1930275 RepID=A0A517NTQ1_9BACT|nr:hypothetical protein K239x_24630 [Planctomycetes bacterium K23_9]